MPIPHIDTSLFNYDLPQERIAKYPLEHRDDSKLLVFRDGQIEGNSFKNLDNFLPKKSTLVFNNTKVIRARMQFKKETGAAIEIFCLEPISPAEITQAFAEKRCTTWKCIVGNSKKWKSGELKTVIGNAIELKVSRLSTKDNTSEIKFEWNDDRLSFAEIIDAIGITPIPPYLNRESEAIDQTRYQTVYSRHKGSVAAPTAGLHFTEEMLEKLQTSDHTIVNITLHVGAGTFKPMQAETAEGHVMHAEHFVVKRESLEQLLQSETIVAVGTTSVRTLETLYWLGVKISLRMPINTGISQWEIYDLPSTLTRKEAIASLISYMKSNSTSEIHSSTQIMIVPGYQFKMIDALVTNFHQPHSTLLLLVSAFIGDNWRKVYDFALQNDFRFLSYGDSSLLFPIKDA